MITVQTQTDIYTLEELTETAREKAILQHMDFLYSVADEDTPREISEEYTADSIEANEYFYYASGEMAQVVTYCGEHPRAGEQVLTQDGKEYTL